MDIKSDKLINAILYFAKKMYLTKTKLMKSLYELDFRHFKETGRSVTGLVYSAWDYGPVPPGVYYKFKKDGSVSSEIKDFIKVVQREKGTQIKNKKEPELKYFTKREQRILNEIIEIYKKANTDIMTGASHEVNKPWDITIKTKGKGAEIDYLLVIDDKSPLSKEEVIQRQEEIKETDRFFEEICS